MPAKISVKNTETIKLSRLLTTMDSKKTCEKNAIE